MANNIASDRDYAIRTIIGEAANQDDDGMAAVGHVINNRVRAGKFGGATAREVVLAPGQFEPWQTRAPELLGYAEDSPEYQRAAKIYDTVVAKDAKDPTGGATHFLNEKIVRERRGGTLPKWANAQGQKIGDHTFYGGKPMNSSPDDALFDEYSRKAPAIAPTGATDPAADDSIFDEYKRAPVTTTPGAGLPRVTIPTENAPRGDVLNASGFNNRMVSSMPIVGPLFDKATAAAGALVQPLVGDKDAPATFSERYDRNLKFQDDQNRLYGEKHPVASVAADITGGTMALGPLARTAIGARMMGMRGASLGSRVYQGAGGMGAIQTGHELLKGENPFEQGVVGPVPLAVAGGAIGPAVGEAVGAGVNKLLSMAPRMSGPLQGTNTITRNKLTGAVEGETPASIAASREAHEPAGGMLMDLNQGTRDLAGGLADIPGQAKGEIREVLRQRMTEQAPRMMQSLDRNTVPHVNIRQLTKSIDDAQNSAATPLYNEFRATKIQPTGEIKALIPRLEKAGAFKMADELAGIAGRDTTENFFTTGAQQAFPTAETWDYVKRGLDRRISTAIDGGDKELYRELVGLKRDMLSQVEKTEGGKIWKKARETFAEYAEMKHQIEEGQKTWLRKTRVDDLAEELGTLSVNERAARQQGARDAIQEAIDATIRGDTTARNALLSRAGREKLDLLFGEKRAGRLLRDLEAEVNVRRNTDEIVGGSPTSSKQARRNALMPQASEPGYLRNIDLTKPSTLIPDWMTPQAIMEGSAAARHAKSHEQLGRFMQVRMGTPEFDALVAEIAQEGSRNAAREATWAGRGTAATGVLAATSPALRNRLLLPPAQPSERGAAK